MKVGVENYWRFNGIKTMKARTKVLGSFEAVMNSPNLEVALARKHYITETQKPIRGRPLLCLKCVVRIANNTM